MDKSVAWILKENDKYLYMIINSTCPWLSRSQGYDQWEEVQFFGPRRLLVRTTFCWWEERSPSQFSHDLRTPHAPPCLVTQGPEGSDPTLFLILIWLILYMDGREMKKDRTVGRRYVKDNTEKRDSGWMKIIICLCRNSILNSKLKLTKMTVMKEILLLAEKFYMWQCHWWQTNELKEL